MKLSLGNIVQILSVFQCIRHGKESSSEALTSYILRPQRFSTAIIKKKHKFLKELHVFLIIAERKMIIYKKVYSCCIFAVF